jgi:hypothetical protein
MRTSTIIFWIVAIGYAVSLTANVKLFAGSYLDSAWNMSAFAFNFAFCSIGIMYLYHWLVSSKPRLENALKSCGNKVPIRGEILASFIFLFAALPYICVTASLGAGFLSGFYIFALLTVPFLLSLFGSLLVGRTIGI